MIDYTLLENHLTRSRQVDSIESPGRRQDGREFTLTAALTRAPIEFLRSWKIAVKAGWGVCQEHFQDLERTLSTVRYRTHSSSNGSIGAKFKFKVRISSSISLTFRNRYSVPLFAPHRNLNLDFFTIEIVGMSDADNDTADSSPAPPPLPPAAALPSTPRLLTPRCLLRGVYVSILSSSQLHVWKQQQQ